jgi:hypothetical protein
MWRQAAEVIPRAGKNVPAWLIKGRAKKYNGINIM